MFRPFLNYNQSMTSEFAIKSFWGAVVDTFLIIMAREFALQFSFLHINSDPFQLKAEFSVIIVENG